VAITIQKRFALDAPPERVWAFLVDPYQVVSVLPGAQVTGKIDDRTYLGAIAVSVGPVRASFRGQARFERMDLAKREVELVCSGQDSSGKGVAEMRMVSRLHPLPQGGTEVTVTSDLNITGVLAQFGRGMIEGVSDQIFERFTETLKERLQDEVTSKEKADILPKRDTDRALPVFSLGMRAVGRALGRFVRRMFGGKRSDEDPKEVRDSLPD
jgi:carbon monoxide dehydrogenase subunit G